MDAEVVVERTGRRVDIVLNRPERRNAVTRTLAVQLRDALVAVSADDSVGAVVLRGAGGAFCSGLDLQAAGPGLVDAPGEAWVAVHAALYSCRPPVVAALERFAINAGAALVLGSGLCVAGEGSFLQVSEIAMGVAAPMNQAWLHLRHSPAVADRVTLVGDRIEAFELLRLGIVTEVVADADVVTRAQALADVIASHPPAGLAAHAAVRRRLRAELDDSFAWFSALRGDA